MIDWPDATCAELVGYRIKRRRTELGLTQDQLAELVGIKRENISRTERGLAEPTLDTIERYAVALKTSFTDLVAAIDGVRRQDPPDPDVVVELDGMRWVDFE